MLYAHPGVCGCRPCVYFHHPPVLQKAGCDGYAEFKIRLRQHLEQEKQPPVKDDVSEVIDFLKKTCSAEFEQKLDMLTRVIFQARHIFL